MSKWTLVEVRPMGLLQLLYPNMVYKYSGYNEQNEGPTDAPSIGNEYLWLLEE